MKKIGTLKGIPVVEGNVNEVTKNQIHYKEEGGGIQLSKRDNDNKLNSITSGSSNGDSGGIKEYYYRVVYDSTHTFAIDMMAFVNLVEVCTIDFRCTHNISYTGYFDALYKVIDEDTLGIKIIDTETHYIHGVANSPIRSLPKGSLEEKLKYLYVEVAQMPIEEFEQYINELHNYLIPITKEEYESLITYKP